MPTLSQLTEVMIKDRKAITSSLTVAEVFNKRHDNVLQIIDRIKKDWKKAIRSKVLTSKMRADSQNELPSKIRAIKERKLNNE